MSDLNTFNTLKDMMVNGEECAPKLMRQLFENTKLSTVRSLARGALGAQGLLKKEEMRDLKW